MRLTRGINHIAVLTSDLDRFVEFYTSVFDLEVVLTETTPAFRHAILRTGADSWLHPAEVVGSDHGNALPTMFERGHLDHLALTAESVAAFGVVRDRLTQRGATDGTLEDLGAFRSLWFTDPDGMRGEVTYIVDPDLTTIHAPKPLQITTPHLDRRVTDVDGRPLSVRSAAGADVDTVVVPLFREYGEWVASNLERDAGITLTPTDLERHHEAFRAELPKLIGPRGRLLVGCIGHEPIGVGALKPVDDTTAEIKRMFVRPTRQGIGMGRALLEALIEQARAEGYTTVRLETLRFMTAARAMYERVGFVATAPFDGSEGARTALDPLLLFMALDLARVMPPREAGKRS